MSSDIDKDCVRQDLESYRHDLTLYGLSRVGDRMLAEDLVQEAFAQYLSRKSSERVNNPKSYLIRTVYNLSVDHFRAQSIRLLVHASEADIDNALGHEPSPEELLSERELKARFDKAYQDLPEKQKSIYYLRRMEGLSTTQIADKFNISKRMVQKYMSRIVLHINSYLMDEE